MNKLNWNKERWRTRDRLLEYDFSIVPAYPHSGGIAVPYPQESERIPISIPYLANVDLPMIYPWENIALSVLSHQLYLIAVDNGYTGTETEFLVRFANGDGDSGDSEKEVIIGTLTTFPMPGAIDKLYLDRETGILYYFKATNLPVNEQAAEDMGIVITETHGNVTYLYIPVRALPIENLIYNCGDASDYIG